MLNRSASLAMSTCVLKALPGKLDIKRHSPSILYIPHLIENTIPESEKTQENIAFNRAKRSQFKAGYQNAAGNRQDSMTDTHKTHTVKPVLSGHTKIDKTKVLKTNGSLMKFESIAECSPWIILQYF